MPVAVRRRYEEAEIHKFGLNSTNTVWAKELTSSDLDNAGDHQAAVVEARQGLDIALSLVGTDDPLTQGVRATLADVSLGAGLTQDAGAILDSIDRKQLEKVDGVRASASWFDLQRARIARLDHDSIKAEALFQSALKELPDDPNFAALGTVILAQHDHEKSH